MSLYFPRGSLIRNLFTSISHVCAGVMLLAILTCPDKLSASEKFNLIVRLSGVSDLANANAQVVYVLERGFREDGTLRDEISDSSLLVQRDKDRNGQFEFRFSDLSFPE
jgi:hypothetical protein